MASLPMRAMATTRPNLRTQSKNRVLCRVGAHTGSPDHARAHTQGGRDTTNCRGGAALRRPKNDRRPRYGRSSGEYLLEIMLECSRCCAKADNCPTRRNSTLGSHWNSAPSRTRTPTKSSHPPKRIGCSAWKKMRMVATSRLLSTSTCSGGPSVREICNHFLDYAGSHILPQFCTL